MQLLRRKAATPIVHVELRHLKCASLKTFVKYPKSIRLPPQQLHTVPAPVIKHKKAPVLRVPVQVVLNLAADPIELLAEIQRPDR